MKLVVAVVKPLKLDDVKDALEAIGDPGMTVTEVQRLRPPARARPRCTADAEYKVEFVPKVKLEVLVEDARRAGRGRRAHAAARTGSIGDGKVWVLPVEYLTRIRTAELGAEAL